MEGPGIAGQFTVDLRDGCLPKPVYITSMLSMQRNACPLPVSLARIPRPAPRRTCSPSPRPFRTPRSSCRWVGRGWGGRRDRRTARARCTSTKAGLAALARDSSV